MSGLVGFSIQEAIDSLLIADDTLLQLLGNGVNSILANPATSDEVAYPILVYNPMIQSAFDTFDRLGATTQITIATFSRQSKFEAQKILNRIKELLHNADLEILGNCTISCRYDDFMEVFSYDNDGIIYQGVILIKIITRNS